MHELSWGFWVGFHLFVFAMVYLDLKVFHRRPSQASLRSLLHYCAFWVALSIAFNLIVGFFGGLEPASSFFTAYLLEVSLSIDNLFVFLMIFSFCRIESRFQHKVLYLGVLGALFFRLIFILLGVSLLDRFEWMYFVFGGFLVASALAFFLQKETREDLDKSLLVRSAKKLFRFDHGPHEGRFFIRKNGKLYGSMLFLSLFLIEGSDIVFAIDSVPAVLAVTSNLFIAYTSNVFAILGLRSFYFLLAHLHEKCLFLKRAISVILFFVGIKLILSPFWEIPSALTLSFIGSVFLIAFLFRKKE